MTQRFMPQPARVAFSHEFAARGLALAERRLAYLTELYETGRWRRFHTEVDFLLNVRDARAAVEAWQRIEQFDPTQKPLPVVAQAAAPLMPPEPIDKSAVTFMNELVSDAIKVAVTEGSTEAPAETLTEPFTEPFTEALDDVTPEPVASVVEVPIRRPTLLPPVMFSAHGVGAQRNLREA